MYDSPPVLELPQQTPFRPLESRPPFYAVVIPALNESATIRDVVVRTLDRVGCVIVVVLRCHDRGDGRLQMRQQGQIAERHGLHVLNRYHSEADDKLSRA